MEPVIYIRTYARLRTGQRNKLQDRASPRVPSSGTWVRGQVSTRDTGLVGLSRPYSNPSVGDVFGFALEAPGVTGLW